MGFLDEAYQLGLLWSVGPVYQFRHATLQDHLAPPAGGAGRSSPMVSDSDRVYPSDQLRLARTHHENPRTQEQVAMSTPPQTSPKFGFGCLVVLAVVLLALAAGVWFVIDSLHSPRRTVAASISDYSDLCASRPIPGAAEYRPGFGSHPIAVFGNAQDDVSTGGIHVLFSRASEAFNPTDPSSVQLVACTERTDEGEQVTTCPYREGSAAMYRATVEITVYEARTRTQVGEPITLEGQSQRCPFLVSYRESSKPRVYTTPTEQQYIDALTPYVQR